MQNLLFMFGLEKYKVNFLYLRLLLLINHGTVHGVVGADWAEETRRSPTNRVAGSPKSPDFEPVAEWDPHVDLKFSEGALEQHHRANVFLNPTPIGMIFWSLQHCV